MARHAMSSADAAWLRMDRPQNLMAITSVLWFDAPLDLPRIRDLLTERLVERFPRFTQRVVDGGALGGAHWEDDADFELDLHVHRVALPAPGGRAELQELVADLMGTPLDRTKALWHVHVVEGYDGGSALVVRMHHCIADGIALAHVMLSLTDPDPEGAPPPAIEPDNARGGIAGLAGPLGPALAAGASVAGSLAHESFAALTHPRRIPVLAGNAVAVARSLGKELTIPSDARGPLRGELHPGERVAWCEPVPLEHIKRIAHAHDATVNDVLVSAVTGGLGRWLSERDPAHPLEREIHAMIPFNLRPLDEPLPRELGNRFGLVLLALPVLEQDPLARLFEVRSRMRAIKDSPEGAVSYGVLAVMGLSPPAVEARLIDLFSAKATLVMTNVPGPREPVYLGGVQLRGVLVWAPCAGSVSTSVSIFSYRGEVTVGFMVDAGLVPDPDAIVAAVDAELAALTPTPDRASGSARARPRRRAPRAPA